MMLRKVDVPACRAVRRRAGVPSLPQPRVARAKAITESLGILDGGRPDLAVSLEIFDEAGIAIRGLDWAQMIAMLSCRAQLFTAKNTGGRSHP
jgi:hypothetical protein